MVTRLVTALPVLLSSAMLTSPARSARATRTRVLLATAAAYRAVQIV